MEDISSEKPDNENEKSIQNIQFKMYENAINSWISSYQQYGKRQQVMQSKLIQNIGKRHMKNTIK